MAKRKMKKATQIKMIQGALKSKKTPRQFIPSLRKRLAKLTAAVAILFVMCGCSITQIHAQGQVYTIPQTVQQTLATNVACNGGNQFYPVKNLGQTQHYLSITAPGSVPTIFSATIVGVNSDGSFTVISDTMQLLTGTTSIGALTATGYFPIVEVEINCTGGNYTLNYSGTSSTYNGTVGGYQNAQVQKILFNAASAATTASAFTQPPFSSASGTLIFNDSGLISAGSTVSVQCIDGKNVVRKVFTYPLATAGGTQFFSVPPESCTEIRTTYTSGGASGATFVLEYFFTEPGLVNSTLSTPVHITGTTATAVKATSGTLIAINLNTSAAGTVSVFDLASASCTGTPSTNIIAVMTIGATELARAIPFNLNFVNGICVQASVAMDLTIGYQ